MAVDRDVGVPGVQEVLNQVPCFRCFQLHVVPVEVDSPGIPPGRAFEPIQVDRWGDQHHEVIEESVRFRAPGRQLPDKEEARFPERLFSTVHVAVDEDDGLPGGHGLPRLSNQRPAEDRIRLEPAFQGSSERREQHVLRGRLHLLKEGHQLIIRSVLLNPDSSWAVRSTWDAIGVAKRATAATAMNHGVSLILNRAMIFPCMRDIEKHEPSGMVMRLASWGAQAEPGKPGKMWRWGTG